MTPDGERFVDGVRALLPNSEDAELIVSIFERSGLLEDPDWDNVPLHCLKAAQLVNFLGWSCMSNEELRLAVMATLVHDVRKSCERKRAIELQGEGVGKSESYTRAADEQSEWLGQFPITGDAVQLSALSGHSSLKWFIGDEYEKRTWAEKLFHLADDLCGDAELGKRRGDTVLMLEDRMTQLAHYYPWLVSEHPDELGGPSWIEVQDRVSAKIMEELADKVGAEIGEGLNSALVAKFNS